jgi:transposase InsO family protein
MRHRARRRSIVEHISVERCRELVGFDAFFIVRLVGAKDLVWQLSRDRLLLLARLGGARELPSRPAPKRAKPAASGWRLERALTDNGNGWRALFTEAITSLGATQARIRAGRPQTNGHVESLHKTILDSTTTSGPTTTTAPTPAVSHATESPQTSRPARKMRPT